MTARITCGGQPVVLDWENDLHEVLEHAWPEVHWPHRGDLPIVNLNNSLSGGEGDSILRSPYADDPPPNINELVIPSGASRYGKALLLMDAESLGTVMESAWGANDLNVEGSSSVSSEGSKQSKVPVVFADGTNTFTWQMFLLQPQAVDGGGELWLVPLADVRYFWHTAPRAPFSFTEGTESDWDDVWSQMISSLPFTANGTKEAIESGFLTPDREIFGEEGLSIAAMADAFAMSVGLRAVHTQNGSGDLLVHFQDSQAAATARDSSATSASEQLAQGGYSPPAPLPTELVLVARKSLNHFRNCGQDVRTEPVDEEVDSDEQALIHAAIWSFYHTTGAGQDEDSGSSTSIDSLLSALSDMLIAWGSLDTFSATYSGIVEWSPNALDDYVMLSAGRDGGMRTIVRGLPSSFRPVVNLCQGTAYYLHEVEEGKFWRILGDVDAADGFAMGSGSAIPMTTNKSTAVLTDDKRSNGSSVTANIWNGAPSDVVAWDGTSTLVQTKRVDCLPVIDVEYCPPEEV